MGRRVPTCLISSSNRASDRAGWVLDPEGTVVAITDESQPFMTLDLQLPGALQTFGTDTESESPISRWDREFTRQLDLKRSVMPQSL